MPLYDWQCTKCDKQFEAMGQWDKATARCECGAKAARVWLSRGERRLMERPMVLHRFADGTWSVPGRNDTRTPDGAEAVEIRSMADYNSAMKRMNAEERATAERRHEQVQAAREQLISERRQQFIGQMNSLPDGRDKDLARAALERYSSAQQASRWTPTFSEAMEMNASNREAWWDRETSAGRGRK